MKVAGYIKTSLIEWPGKIASVVFVPGCNFRCPFCHNADLVAEQKRGVTLIDEKQILADLLKRKKWVEAVVVTGGEPTLRLDISRFISRIKQMGFLVMLHTNGTKPEIINELIIKKLTDYIAMDIKGDFDEYDKYTKIKYQISKIKKSVELIVKSGVEYEFRTTVVPGLHDLKNLIKLADEIKTILNTKYKIQNTKWFLQQFRPLNTLDKNYLKIKPYSAEELKKMCHKLQKILPQTRLRGV